MSRKTEYVHNPCFLSANILKILGVFAENQNLLEQKEILNQGVYLSSGFSELVDSLNYPYSIYLKLAGELMMHDIITSQITAKSLLEF